MRRFGCLAVPVLLVFLFTGCGQAVPKTIEESTLVIFKDGRLTAYLVGEFDKSYYDLTELTAMAQDEATEFGGTKDTAPVKMESVEPAQDGSSRVVVTYTFDSAGSYEDFIEDTLFYGTVEEALVKGYGSNVTLQNVKDDSLLTGRELSQEQERHLIVFCPKQTKTPKVGEEKHLVISCPEKVEFLSGGAVLNQDGTVDVSWTEENALTPVYILMKK